MIEIQNCIKTFKNNKSPGTDGLPIEFYKIFWNKIKEPLLNSYLDSIKKMNYL